MAICERPPRLWLGLGFYATAFKTRDLHNYCLLHCSGLLVLMIRSKDTSEGVISVLLARNDNGWNRVVAVKKVKSRKMGICCRTTIK